MKINIIIVFIILPALFGIYYIYDLNEENKKAEIQERLSFDRLSDETVSEWLKFSERKIRSKVSLSYGKLKFIEHDSDYYFYYPSDGYIINCDLIGVEIEFYGGRIPSKYIYIYPDFYGDNYRYKPPNLEFDMISIAGRKLKNILCVHAAKVMYDISSGQ